MKPSKQALTNWASLNAFIKKATEPECHRLMSEELRGSGRKQFLLRIQSRLNRVTRRAELAKIKEKWSGGKK